MHSGRGETLTGSMASGIFFSDEPGYYEDDNEETDLNFGIRLETILRVISMDAPSDTYGIL